MWWRCRRPRTAPNGSERPPNGPVQPDGHRVAWWSADPRRPCARVRAHVQADMRRRCGRTGGTTSGWTNGRLAREVSPLARLPGDGQMAFSATALNAIVPGPGTPEVRLHTLSIVSSTLSNYPEVAPDRIPDRSGPVRDPIREVGYRDRSAPAVRRDPPRAECAPRRRRFTRGGDPVRVAVPRRPDRVGTAGTRRSSGPRRRPREAPSGRGRSPTRRCPWDSAR